MSANSYNTVFEHSSDATYRAWRDALIALIDAENTASGKWARTTDTGQTTSGSGSRPGVSTVESYIIIKATDTLAGSAPIYIKLEFGTGVSAAIPQVWVQTGTGSNGSGTLTGSTSTRNIWTRQTAITSNVTLYPTYVSSNEGSITIGLKLGAGSGGTGFGFLGVGRPCNLDASLRSDAVAIAINTAITASTGVEIVRFSDGVKFGSNNNKDFGMVPYGITNSAVGLSFQMFQCIAAYPQIYGINWMGIALGSEYTINTNDSATFYGATSHNYLSLGVAAPAWSTTATAGHVVTMLYE